MRLHVREAYRPIVTATLLLVAVFTIGVAGYLILTHGSASVLDAIYMTVITLTTVGYGEHIPLAGNPSLEVFTIVLLFFGVGTFVYFFSSLTGFIVEGHLDRMFWRKRMQKSIDRLEGHYIICGSSHTTHYILSELMDTERDFVLIDENESWIDQLQVAIKREFPSVVGDPTDDQSLIAAGIRKAAGLFANTESDKDNLIITVSAKMLSPGVKVVARVDETGFEGKIQRAGADVVVSPAAIGGLRMISEMVRPAVVSFLDLMLRDKDRRLRVEESRVRRGSEMDGTTVGDLRQRDVGDLLLVAIRHADQGWTYNPPDGTVLKRDSTLVYMGSPDARQRVERLCAEH